MARNSQEQMQQIQTLMHWNRMKQTEQQLQQQHLQRQRLNERNERLWQNQMLQQQIRSRAASMTQLNVYTSSPMSRPYIEQHSGECGWNGSVPMMQMSTDPYRTNHGRSISTADLAQSVSPAQFARVDRHTLNKSHDRWLQLQSPTPRPSSNVGLQMKLDSERLALNRRHVSLNDIRSQLSHNASPTFRKTTLQSTNHSNPYSFRKQIDEN